MHFGYGVGECHPRGAAVQAVRLPVRVTRPACTATEGCNDGPDLRSERWRTCAEVHSCPRLRRPARPLDGTNWVTIPLLKRLDTAVSDHALGDRTHRTTG
ncbi:hypothetical protein Amsp01_043970 [Amycolatopsis sp. NBRC 101858]|nr:hypothetical protein Amsp01_043970 [Amycolatopsis sp. NBRC 101858]